MIGDSLNAIPLTQLDTATEVVYIRQNSSINPTDSSSSDYDTEYASSNFGTVTYYTTNQSSNPIPYRWVKLSRKTKRLSGHDVNNGGLIQPRRADLLRSCRVPLRSWSWN